MLPSPGTNYSSSWNVVREGVGMIPSTAIHERYQLDIMPQKHCDPAIYSKTRVSLSILISYVLVTTNHSSFNNHSLKTPPWAWKKPALILLNYSFMDPKENTLTENSVKKEYSMRKMFVVN